MQMCGKISDKAIQAHVIYNAAIIITEFALHVK